jgi:hypothetical protein
MIGFIFVSFTNAASENDRSLSLPEKNKCDNRECFIVLKLIKVPTNEVLSIFLRKHKKFQTIFSILLKMQTFYMNKN